MDAIPSLCASSASCAAAAIGLAFAQSHPTDRSQYSLQSSHTWAGPSRQTPTSDPADLISVFRPRPATNSQADSLKRISGLSGLEEEGEKSSVGGREQLPRPHTSRQSQDIQKRSSWYRRFPIVPSVDGSVGSPSLQQPSTPSVFSNGSSASPFFGHTINTVTPPNKLVKRSTSHRGLHSEYPAESSFALTGRGPTFRRPATSHQRSETLRLRNARQNLVTSDSPDLTSESWFKKSKRDSFVERLPDRSTFFRPFFRYQQRSIVREPGTGRASGSKIFGPAGHITSVISTAGEHAILVLGNCVERPKMDSPSPVHPVREIQEDYFEEQVTNPTLTVKRSRHSFSTERVLAAPTTWKLRRGGSLRRNTDNESREPRAADRRIVSAPHHSNKLDKSMGNVSQGWQSERLASPSARQIETDRHKSGSSYRDSLGFDDSFTGSDLDAEPVSILSKQQPGLRLKSASRQGSRVPSDRSTVFGSDNETSRVFSVNGDDTDLRSDTVYDSLRTEASTSSHSGARNYRAENVFGDNTRSDSDKHEIPTLHERLTNISIARDDAFIAEEDENIRTPVWQEQSDDEKETPSARRHNSTRRLSPVRARSVNKKSMLSAPKPIHQLQDNTDDSSDKESFWDDEFEAVPIEKGSQDLSSSDHPSPTTFDRPKSNIFEWSESPSGEPDSRPKTSHPEQGTDRGGRPISRRPTNGFHLRSQSVPLAPDSAKNKFNNTKNLDTWMLGNKGASEDWDNDFEFDDAEAPEDTAEDTGARAAAEFVVPKEILDRQATVHGQFGQVKELTLLVKQLRKLHDSATLYGILDGQSSELWREAIGIIDLATLDEEEPEIPRPLSPGSLSADFEAFDDDPATPRSYRANNLRSGTPSGHKSSPASSKQGTPGRTRPRHDSVVRAKNVLANIHQHRDPLDPPLEIEEEPVSEAKEKKMPFDTTSLRDLVIRAGVVTRACKELIRKVEDPDYVSLTPEFRSSTPEPPFFSQIFQQQSSSTNEHHGLERGVFSAKDHVSLMTAV